MTEKDDFDPQIFLPYLLNQAAESASLAFQQLYKQRYGMLRTEWRVLFHLGIYGQMTATDIGFRAKVHKTKISRAVSALEARRFLTRTRKDSDRRQEVLELTAKGRAAYDDLRQVAQNYERDLVAGFSPEELQVLRRALTKLSQN